MQFHQATILNINFKIQWRIGIRINIQWSISKIDEALKSWSSLLSNDGPNIKIGVVYQILVLNRMYIQILIKISYDASKTVMW